MLCQVEVLSVPSSDTPAEPVIVVSYDNCRYLFNCGEGAQRSLLAAKVPVRKIQEVFLTSGWQSHGGIAGLLLSITSQTGPHNVGIHGPKNLAFYLASLRAGQQRDYRQGLTTTLAIEEYETRLPPMYTDKNITIQPVLAFSASDDQAVKAQNKPQGQINADDLVRVNKIAQTVWSGEFLELDAQGSWTAANPVVPSANATKTTKHTPRKRSFSTLEASERTNEKKDTTNDSKVKSAITPWKPSYDQFQAFNKYMFADLPDGYEPFSSAVSYVIQGQAMRGRFNPTRAKELGVKAGPDFARLQQGHPVSIDRNITIHPHQVMGPPRICPAIVLLSCPSHAFLESLCGNPFWTTLKDEKQPSLVIHSCSKDVLSDERYIDFMTSFGPQVKHFYSTIDEIHDAITIVKQAKYAEGLQNLSPEIYNTPKVLPETSTVPKTKYEVNALDCSLLEADLRFTPYPTLNISKMSEVAAPPLTEQHAALLERYRIECLATQAAVAKLQPNASTASTPGADVEILTLGTGSAGPSNHRNVSGTMIIDSSPNGFNTLLDCGENTVGQICRAFGETTASAMQALRVVFISHLHADHHLGLIGLVKFWLAHNAENENKLFIVCPLRLGRSVLEYGNIDADFHLHRIVLINGWNLTQNYQEAPENKETSTMVAYHEMCAALPGLAGISTVPANHSERSTCVRINHKDGWSVAFSGDTRPSSSFIALAQDATCLVHEATFEDGLLDEAYKKKHSTIGEALHVAQEARVQSVILTHLSQRYPKAPVVSESQMQELANGIGGFAVDLMRIKIRDIWKLGHHLRPQVNLAKGLDKLKIREDDETEQILLDDI